MKLLDFGLATARVSGLDGDDETVVADELRTQVGTVMGTVGYMSPEQVRGETADARSDLFSLGAVLYEMTTGARAFNRDSAVETMTAILRDPLPNPARADLSSEHRMYEVISRCLAKSPEDRFDTAEELLAALEETPAVETPRDASRTPIIAGLAVAITATAEPNKAKTLKIGDAAPEFKIKDTNGKQIDLNKLTKKGPVLVRLTCGCLGCDRELPYFQAVHEAYKKEGIQFVAIFAEPDEKFAKDAKSRRSR